MRLAIRTRISRSRQEGFSAGVLGLSGTDGMIGMDRDEPTLAPDGDSRHRIDFLPVTASMAPAAGPEEVLPRRRATFIELPKPVEAPVCCETPAVPRILPRPDDAALRLALQLQTVTGAGPERVLLFVPVSGGHSPVRVVREAALALVRLGEGPALIIDLREQPWSTTDETCFDIFSRSKLEGLRSCPLRGSPGTPDDLTVEVLDLRVGVGFIDIRGVLDDMRERFSSILCLGGPVTESAESLLVSSLSDATVLSVAAWHTTTAGVRAAAEELQRVNARILGFVLERPTP